MIFFNMNTRKIDAYKCKENDYVKIIDCYIIYTHCLDLHAKP